MRVAHLTQSYPPMTSGAALTVQQLATGQATQGHETMVLAASDRPEPYRERRNHLEIVRLRSHKNVLRVDQRYLRWPRAEVLRHLDSFRPDLVHVHEPLMLGLAGLSAADRLGAPAVLTMHQLPRFVSVSTPLPRPLQVVVEKSLWRYGRWFASRCAAVVAPTTTVADTLAREIGLEACAINWGVDLDRFSPEPAREGEAAQLRRRFGLDPHRPLILHVGRLDRDKRVDRVVRVAARVMRRTDAQLLVVGDGRERARLLAQAQALGVEERCHFPGFVKSVAELAGLYRAGDLFVTASEIETFCLVALEAMASGLPVVAPRATCLPELIADGRTGFLTPVGDEPAMARRIEQLLLDHELARQMGRAGRDKAQSLSAQRALERYLGLYEQLAGRTTA